jgi:uncharacterized protein (TIGR02266 family)
MGSEKRRTLRVPVAFRVKVDTARGRFNGVGRDLSEGGMGVYLPKLPPLGSQVEMEFVLSEGADAIRVSGEVSYHQRGSGGATSDWMGVRFVRMDTASHEAIRRFVSSHMGMPPPAGPPPLPRTSG